MPTTSDDSSVDKGPRGTDSAHTSILVRLVLATLAGLFVPGLGHILSKRYRTGAIFFVAAIIGYAGFLYAKAGQYAQAVQLFQRALAIKEKLLGPEHWDLHYEVSNLAALATIQGEYAKAESLYKRAVAISSKSRRPTDPSAAFDLNNLGHLYMNQGKYAEAEIVFKQALSILDQPSEAGRLSVAKILNSLGGFFRSQGQPVQAILHFKRALAIQEKELGAEDPDVAESLENLGQAFYDVGVYDEAEALFKRALAIYEKALGPEHDALATSLNDLAHLYTDRAQYALAEHLYKRAVAILEKAQGPNHPIVAAVLNNLADLYREQGRYTLAEPLHRRALAIFEQALGPDDLPVAAALESLASTELAQNQFGQALPLLQRAQQIRESVLRRVASEPRVSASLHKSRVEAEVVYGLLPEKGHNAGLRSLALTLTLLRKGRAAEAGAQAGRAILNSLATASQRALFDKWQHLRAERDRLIFTAPVSQPDRSYNDRLIRLGLSIDDLEHDLAAASPQLASLQVPRWSDVVPQVAGKLPPASALLELVRARPYRSAATSQKERYGEPHYIALLLFPDQQIDVVDLGDAQAIDRAALEFLQQVRNPVQNPQPAAQALYQKVMAPLQSKLPQVTRLYVSPEGIFNLVPFAALHDGTAYLVDRYQLHYLTSGRDLLREPAGHASAPLILADPDYERALQGTAPGASHAIDTQSLYAQLSGLRRLPATRQEAEAIARLLPDAQVRLGGAATEGALRQAQAPVVLHIATHGLYLDDASLQTTTRGTASRALTPLETELPGVRSVISVAQLLGGAVLDPFLRSALVLADAAPAQEPSADTGSLILTNPLSRSARPTNGLSPQRGRVPPALTPRLP